MVRAGAIAGCRSKSVETLAGASPRMMVLVSSRGSQKTPASGGAARGSTGKSQPPPLADLIGERPRITLGGGQCLEIPVVSFVAAEPLPRDIGCADALDMVVESGRAPARRIWCQCGSPCVLDLGKNQDSRAGCFGEVWVAATGDAETASPPHCAERTSSR